MSLYCFGKLLVDADLSPSVLSIPHVMIGRIDPVDAEALDDIQELSEDGIYFSICDDEGSAGQLWTGATDSPSDDLRLTRLGRVVHALLHCREIQMGGIAFVDGGIDTIRRGSREECWRWFSNEIKRPWDNMDNPLLIWSRGA